MDKQHFNIYHLLVLLTISHLIALAYPVDHTVMDEFYYVKSGKDLLELKPSNLEHPFMGKMWAGLGIGLFGDNIFGWRIFYVVLGTISVYVFYLLCLNFLCVNQSLFASFILAIDNIYFLHSTFALLEIPALTFGLLGALLYLKRRYYLSAFVLGIAILNKEIALLFPIGLLIYHVIMHRQEILGRIPLGLFMLKGIISSLILVGTFLWGMTLYDLIYKPVGIQDGIGHVFWILDYAKQLVLDANPTLTRGNLAYNWIIPTSIPFTPMPYFVDQRGFVQWLGIGNLVLWWSVWLIFPIFTRKEWNRAYAFAFAWVIGNYLPMIAMTVLAHRIVYPFYFVQVLPGLAILSVKWISLRKYKEYWYYAFMSVSIGAFIGCLPLTTYL